MAGIKGAIRQIGEGVGEGVVKPVRDEVGQDLEEIKNSLTNTPTSHNPQAQNNQVSPQEQVKIKQEEERRKRFAWDFLRKYEQESKLLIQEKKSEKKQKEMNEERKKEEIKEFEIKQRKQAMAQSIQDKRTKSETRKGVGG